MRLKGTVTILAQDDVVALFDGHAEGPETFGPVFTGHWMSAQDAVVRLRALADAIEKSREAVMSFDPTPDDIVWMANRLGTLREARLAKLGYGAKLSQPEEDAILQQAIIDGAKHRTEVDERAAHQALMDKRKRDEQDRAAGKPTLRTTFGELVGNWAEMRKVKR
jgi:hypothetical protein